MATIISNIPRIVPGGPSLVSAELANMLIDRINALYNLQVLNANNIAKVQVTGSQVFIDFSLLEQRLSNPNISASGVCSGNNIIINIGIDI